MDDQLDKDLGKRIQEVFDNYEDTSANEGWLKLREKFPEERKRRTPVWLWPAAALLLLFLGVGLNMVFNRQPDHHIAATKSVKHSPVIPGAQMDSSRSGQTALASATQNQSLTNTKDIHSLNKKDKNIANSNTDNRISDTRTGGKLNNAINAQSHSTQPLIAASARHDKSSSPPPTSSANAGNNTSPVQATTLVALAATDTADKTVIASPTKPQLAVVTKPDNASGNTPQTKPVISAKKPQNINEMFAADQGKAPDETSLKPDMRVKFGVYAATYINYAKNGTNQVNAGGGFTATILLVKNLKLVTGASVNQNSFNYSNQGFLAAAVVPAALYSMASNNRFSVANTTITSNSRSASLLGIDVPLNLQYQFNTNNHPVYVMGGVSSGTFINESYGNVYSDGSTQNTNSYKGLNDFYFARTLNFGFGVGYPIGKSQLIFEPFIKYPLTGMGAQQLKFGASGINLKFNLPTKKQ